MVCIVNLFSGCVVEVDGLGFCLNSLRCRVPFRDLGKENRQANVRGNSILLKSLRIKCMAICKVPVDANGKAHALLIGGVGSAALSYIPLPFKGN